ncbi:MAG: CBS domain-containing protein [Planctomycetota bacterium]|jgi:CBS domain-containing protein
MTEDERVRRFEIAYNRVDHYLGEAIGDSALGRRRRFAARVRTAAHRRRRLARHVDFLLEAGELRNAIVHNRLGDGSYIAVPNEQTVLELERIERKLSAPDRVFPRFERTVRTLAPDSTLADALGLIRDDGFSRYPVYGREGFVGLLTANGVTRWCADQLHGGHLEVDATAVHVADLLEADHHRENVAFVARDALVDDVDEMFSDTTLEAVIITEHGRTHEKPLGMICPPDVAALEN